MILGLCAFGVLVFLYWLEARGKKKGKRGSNKDVWGKDTDAQYFFFEDFHSNFK